MYRIVPIRAQKKKKHHIPLLWICEPGKSCNTTDSLIDHINNYIQNTHYCFIKDLSRLVRKQWTNRNNKLFICEQCLNFFYCEEKLQKHETYCSEINDDMVVCPKKENKWISFKNYKHQLMNPFIIYADIECVLKNVSNVNTIITNAYQKHVPCSVAFYFKCIYDSSKSFYSSKTSTDCIAWFAEELKKICEMVVKLHEIKKPIMFTDQDKFNFDNASNCYICNKPFYEFDDKVKDHSHLTGIYRGAAHNKCNLTLQESKIIPVVFHNLKYDLHFLIETLSDAFKGNLSIIPLNSENYISFSKIYATNTIGTPVQLRFIDSFGFLPSSLASLAKILPFENMHITKKEYSDMKMEDVQLLCKKGIFPYDYLDTFEKL